MASALRPGNAPPRAGARSCGACWRNCARPLHATVRVRLDGGFAHPKLFEVSEQQDVEYVVAMARNPRLEKRARRLMGKAGAVQGHGETADP